MRVLMFGWEYPPVITGGLGTACFGLNQALSSLVDKITFVLPRASKDQSSDKVEVVDPSIVKASKHISERLSEIEFIQINSHLRAYAGMDVDVSQQFSLEIERVALEKAGGHALVGSYGDNMMEEVLRYAALAAQLVLDADYDVIHAHDWMTFLAGVQAKRISSLPLVVHAHALEFDRSGDAINQQIYEIEKYGMQQADRVIAVSLRTKEQIIEHYGIQAEKITVLHNGVEALGEGQPVRAPKQVPEKLVVFLGRLTRQKGPEYFLEAAYLVSRVLKDVRFVMAGSGDMLPRMVMRMAELRMGSRFHFTGFLDDAYREKLFSMTDLFVMSSVSEPFGITPLEAMRHEVPVIVSKQSGVSEVLSHAIKVDFWDVRKMADAMIAILTKEALREQMINGGQRDLSHISWEDTASGLLRLYKEVAS